MGDCRGQLKINDSLIMDDVMIMRYLLSQLIEHIRIDCIIVCQCVL